jgi:hypothetical protein
MAKNYFQLNEIVLSMDTDTQYVYPESINALQIKRIRSIQGDAEALVNYGGRLFYWKGIPTVVNNISGSGIREVIIPLATTANQWMQIGTICIEFNPATHTLNIPYDPTSLPISIIRNSDNAVVVEIDGMKLITWIVAPAAANISNIGTTGFKKIIVP